MPSSWHPWRSQRRADGGYDTYRTDPGDQTGPGSALYPIRSRPRPDGGFDSYETGPFTGRPGKSGKGSGLPGGCIALIVVAVILVALIGGGIMLLVLHAKHLDQFGDPVGSHDPLTMTSTCQSWNSGGPDVIKQYNFFGDHVDSHGTDFYNLDMSKLTAFCLANPDVQLIIAIPGRVIPADGVPLTAADIHP